MNIPTATEPRKLRVLLVDDHILVRMGLSFAIGNQPDMEVVGQAEDGEEAITLFRQHHPDVVVIDLRMPKRSGVEAIGILRREFGAVRILVLSNYASGDEIAAALQAGASGFLGKDAPLPVLLEAIRQVHAGEQVVADEAARRLASRLSSQLSARELEVLTLLGRGMSNKEIGVAIGVVESTVKVHVTNILAKLGVADRTQAVLAGVRRGIIHLE